MRIKRAILSVWDKREIEELAEFLAEKDVEIISSGGTWEHLLKRGISVKEVKDVTGMEEMLEGRVKTLHPAVHGGILARRWLKEDMKEIERLGIKPIDLVVVNLYPFEKAVIEGGKGGKEALKYIDIGGPTLIRAAAKNYPAVVVLTSPE